MQHKYQKQLLKEAFRQLKLQPKILQISFFWWPTILGFALLIGGLKYVYETEYARPQMAYMGVPKTQNNWQNLTHTLRNDGYMVGYSEKYGNPLWVTYKVTQNQKKLGKRGEFHADWRSLRHVTSDDYRRTGYDRGHMAPNYLIGSRYGREAQLQTFLMTNITPQKHNFNAKIWQRLEEVSADVFSKQFPSFWVVTGPIFSQNPKMLKGTDIAIPTAFYKIFVRPSVDGNPPIALAFIMPQTAKPDDSLMKYVVTIDEVEQRTGIDFFWKLNDTVENKLEAHSNINAWGLPAVANRPSRY
ncbi:DNA/RNA non-specific endonuclease [Hydrogenovibrio sp. JE_KL2]|uniref:DNA/RNA non-specific endonuclease n=1 Tax=Hydrogenovibrio sp. JE_KL2 TaxID=2651188 RepID=UPI00128E312C|nr:DNA/RNA non-specific endonuclease [Hydrogenovibrio sp. JE_KL2]MPQ76599.1 DNA/RNA non-specific endonuclease [Hydrogenovibrio sp. JE_KL2]